MNNSTETPRLPLLTVIVPVYKVEDYLSQCVNSILSQDYTNLEVILVDDGSPDSSGAICDRYATTDARVKVVHKANQGLGMARNSGLEIATGDYVTYIDSDDWYVDNSVLSKVMKRTLLTDADVALDGMHRQQSDGSFTDELLFDRERCFDTPEQLTLLAASIINGRPGIEGRKLSSSVWTGIYKRSVALHRFYSEREVASEDIHYKARAILEATKVIYVPVLAVNYRYNNTSLSKSYFFEKYDCFKTLTTHLQELFTNTSMPDAGDYCMIYAAGSALQGMFMSDTPRAKRSGYLRTIVKDKIWDTLRIDPMRLGKKERVVHHIVNTHENWLMQLFAESYYFFKRLSPKRHHMTQV